MSILKKFIRTMLHPLGLEIVNYNAYNQNIEIQKINNEQRLAYTGTVEKLQHIVQYSHFPSSEAFNEFNFFRHSIPNLVKSHSQLFQDLFVLYYFSNKKNGFFVEFGATDGVTLSNTYLLEKEYNWNGILCEPGKIWHHALAANRAVSIDHRCVWSTTGELFNFNESPIAELSTLEAFSGSDFHADSRKNGLIYTTETVSLIDLLQQHNAPTIIDYLSIDTEGSEFDILEVFDFNKYSIQVITVEHNFSSRRNDIYQLLTRKGYERIFETISSFDDWYIKKCS